MWGFGYVFRLFRVCIFLFLLGKFFFGGGGDRVNGLIKRVIRWLVYCVGIGEGIGEYGKDVVFIFEML